MTIYITFVRAKAVSSLKNAMTSQNKTQIRVLKELGIYVSLFTIVFIMVSGLLIHFVNDYDTAVFIQESSW